MIGQCEKSGCSEPAIVESARAPCDEGGYSEWQVGRFCFDHGEEFTSGFPITSMALLVVVAAAVFEHVVYRTGDANSPYDEWARRQLRPASE